MTKGGKRDDAPSFVMDADLSAVQESNQRRKFLVDVLIEAHAKLAKFRGPGPESVDVADDLPAILRVVLRGLREAVERDDPSSLLDKGGPFRWARNYSSTAESGPSPIEYDFPQRPRAFAARQLLDVIRKELARHGSDKPKRANWDHVIDAVAARASMYLEGRGQAYGLVQHGYRDKDGRQSIIAELKRVAGRTSVFRDEKAIAVAVLVGAGLTLPEARNRLKDKDI